MYSAGGPNNNNSSNSGISGSSSLESPNGDADGSGRSPSPVVGRPRSKTVSASSNPHEQDSNGSSNMNNNTLAVAAKITRGRSRTVTGATGRSEHMPPPPPLSPLSPSSLSPSHRRMSDGSVQLDTASDADPNSPSYASRFSTSSENSNNNGSNMRAAHSSLTASLGLLPFSAAVVVQPSRAEVHYTVQHVFFALARALDSLSYPVTAAVLSFRALCLRHKDRAAATAAAFSSSGPVPRLMHMPTSNSHSHSQSQRLPHKHPLPPPLSHQPQQQHKTPTYNLDLRLTKTLERVLEALADDFAQPAAVVAQLGWLGEIVVFVHSDSGGEGVVRSDTAVLEHVRTLRAWHARLRALPALIDKTQEQLTARARSKGSRASLFVLQARPFQCLVQPRLESVINATSGRLVGSIDDACQAFLEDATRSTDQLLGQIFITEPSTTAFGKVTTVVLMLGLFANGALLLNNITFHSLFHRSSSASPMPWRASGG